MVALYDHFQIAKSRLMDRVEQRYSGIEYNTRGWGNDQDDYDIQTIIGNYVTLPPNVSVSDLYRAVDDAVVPDIPEGVHDEDLRWSVDVYMHFSGGERISASVAVYLHWRQIEVSNKHLIELTGKDRKKYTQRIRNRIRNM